MVERDTIKNLFLGYKAIYNFVISSGLTGSLSDAFKVDLIKVFTCML